MCCVLGGLGQLGIECAKLLRGKYGEDSVILSDIIKPNRTLAQGGPYIFADILDFKVSNADKKTPFSARQLFKYARWCVSCTLSGKLAV